MIYIIISQLCLSGCLSVRLLVCVFWYPCLSGCLSFSLFVCVIGRPCLSICWFVCLDTHKMLCLFNENGTVGAKFSEYIYQNLWTLSVHLFVCQFLCSSTINHKSLSVCLSVCLLVHHKSLVHLFVCQFVCSSTTMHIRVLFSSYLKSEQRPA